MKAKSRKLSRAEQKAFRPIQSLDAAFEEFVANGYTATRVEDIAERIGVTKGTIYVYFPTKEDVFTAMINHISVPLEELLADAAQLRGGCAERLQALLLLVYERVSDNRQVRELIRFVISDGSRFPHVIKAHHDDLIEPLFNITQSLLDEGIATGEFRDTPAALAPVIVAPLIARMVDTLIFEGTRNLDLPSYIKAHLDLVLSALAVPRP